MGSTVSYAGQEDSSSAHNDKKLPHEVEDRLQETNNIIPSKQGQTIQTQNGIQNKVTATNCGKTSNRIVLHE